MFSDSLIAIFARRALGEHQSQEIVDWAVQELVAGRDTPEICVLAGMSEPLYVSEVDAQFQKTLDEMGIVPPDKETRLRLYARQIAQALLDDTISIPTACDTLRGIYTDSYESEYAIWDALHSAWWDISYEGISRYYYKLELTRENFDEVVRKEAREFLEAHV